MVDCLPSAIIHAYMGESVIPYITRKSAEKHQELLPVEVHSNQYLYYASDFFSSINTYDIVSYLNKHSEVYYLLITDFLIRNTSKELLFCDLFLSPYHVCLDEKTDKLETSFYAVIIMIELIFNEVKMHVRQEAYSYIASTYNVEQASLLWLSQLLRNNLCRAMTGFNLNSDEHVKQFDYVSVYHDIVLLKLQKCSYFDEICRHDDRHQVLKTQIISISPEIQTIKKSIWFYMLINQQPILGISILTNRILLHELQSRLIILFAWWRINDGICINLFTDNTSVFSIDIGKENYISLIIFAITLQKLLDISLYNLVFTFNNEAIFQQLINPEYSSVIGRN